MSTKQEIVERLMKLAPRSRVREPNEYSEYHHGYKNACLDFAERLAENAVVVDAHLSTSGTGSGGAPTWIARPWQDRDSTHTALLIDIQPIRKVDPLVEKLRSWADSASGTLESVLLEAASRIEQGSTT